MTFKPEYLKPRKMAYFAQLFEDAETKEALLNAVQEYQKSRINTYHKEKLDVLLLKALERFR